MRYNNSKGVIYTPLILALVLVTGIFIGNRLSRITVLDPFLLYQTQNKVDDLLEVINENYVDSIYTDSIVESIIPEVLAHLDPHSVYIPAADFQSATESLEGNFDGIGIQFNIQNDTVLVVNVVANGPAEKVGVRQGDRIITINDSAYIRKNIDNADVIKLLKGARGSKVKIGVLRKQKKGILKFEINRGKIPIFSVDAAYMLSSEIAFIKINKFARTTHQEFLKAIEKLKALGMKELILDLRGNTGGYLDQAVNIADEFLENKKLIVYTLGRTRPRFDYLATPNGKCEKLPLTILIDSYSASASEVLAGAIQDNDRGDIIGQRSFGKGLVQDMMVFKDGSSIRLTTARYYTPTGRFIQKPYLHGNQEYYMDIDNRIDNHELENKDSIKFSATQKFKTPKGKIVYGGGGIMPDFFVPIDTSGYSTYFLTVSTKGLVYNFAMDYLDQNSEALKTYKQSEELIQHLKNQNLLRRFVTYASAKGMTANVIDIEKSRHQLELHIIAYISRDILGSECFYKVLEPIDNVLAKAIELQIKVK